MNKNTEKQLEAAITKGLEIAERGGEFVIDQAPEILREFYKWHITLDLVIILISFPILAISIFYLYKWITDTDRWGEYENKGMPSIFLGIGSFLFFIGYSLDLIKILIAPKLYLIEYFFNE